MGMCVFAGEEISLSRSSSSNREADFDSGPPVSNAESPAGVLQEIGMKCGTKVIVVVFNLYSESLARCICMSYPLEPSDFSCSYCFLYHIGGVHANFGCIHGIAVFC